MSLFEVALKRVGNSVVGQRRARAPPNFQAAKGRRFCLQFDSRHIGWSNTEEQHTQDRRRNHTNLRVNKHERSCLIMKDLSVVVVAQMISACRKRQSRSSWQVSWSGSVLSIDARLHSSRRDLTYILDSSISYFCNCSIRTTTPTSAQIEPGLASIQNTYLAN